MWRIQSRVAYYTQPLTDYRPVLFTCNDLTTWNLNCAYYSDHYILCNQCFLAAWKMPQVVPFYVD